MKRVILYLFFSLCMSQVMKGQTVAFSLPEVPQMLVNPTDRANYLAKHYWDRFDFKDNGLIGRAEITEQGFVNFISIMPYVTEKKEAFAVFARRMAENSKMMEHLLEVGEHYLFDNFSPVYDEELYLVLVEELLKRPELSLVQKDRLRYQQGLAMKNRANHLAMDFSFVLRNGQRMNLKSLKGELVLLYLNDPECSACKRIKEELEQSDIIGRWRRSGRMKVVSVCIEGKTTGWENIPAPAGWMDGCDDARMLLEEDLYDLRNLPAIYLLDADKRILLKNATLQRLEQMLERR